MRLEELPSASRVGIGYVLDEELLPISPPRDPDHIEAHGPVEEPAAREIARGGLGHVLAFLRAYRVEGRSIPSGGTELDLDEHHLVPVAHHEVDLTAPHAHVPVHDFHSAEHQKFRGDPLAAPSRPLPPHPALLRSPRSPPERRGALGRRGSSSGGSHRDRYA